MQLSIAVILCLCIHFDGVSLHPQASSTHPDDNESRKAFLTAIKDGNENEFQRLLMNGVDVNTSDKDGITALMWATGRGYDKIARMLIQKGANMNAVDKNHDPALTNAAFYGNENAVRLLVESGADINILSRDNGTALIIAAYRGRDRIAEFLIEQGADINKVGWLGTTAIYWAARDGMDKILRMLIERGANVNTEDGKRNPVIIDAVSNGHESSVRLLVESGSDVNAVSALTNDSILITAIDLGFDRIAEFLIKSGANVNVVGKSGHTALMYAVDKASAYEKVDAKKSEAFVKIGRNIIEKGANIEARNSDGDTALMVAAGNGNYWMTNALRERGANKNAVNNANQTALIKAILGGHKDAAWDFLEWETANIDVNIGRHQNDSALIIAIANRFPQGISDINNQLISMGADVNAVGNNGFTPLLASAMVGNEKIARILIEKGANVNATNDDGVSALILAVRNNHVGISKMLIDNGAYIDCKGANDETPLIIAAGYVSSLCQHICQGSEEVLQYLIDKGANVNSVDKNNRTALDAAFEANKSEDRKKVINLLIQHGAERGAILLYRKTAVKACKLYSDLTSRWNDGITGRIFGGSLALIGEFPWMVALGYLSSQYKVRFSCGGSLISDKFVLTAAHCVLGNDRPVIARLGKVTLTDENDFQTENQNIREIISHPGYSTVTKKNDIALIRLNEDPYVTRFIQPICIQTLLRDEDAQTNLTVTGWGITNIRKTSTKLLKASLETMPVAECNATFWNYNKDRNLPAFQQGIDTSQYCAHDPIENRDSCKGDSGGPLQTTQTFSNPAKVVGVVSFGINCGSRLPGIYTRVAHYIDWIGAHVWPNGEIQTPRVSMADDDGDVNSSTNDTALIQAISRKYDSTARRLIEEGTDLNAVGDDGFTPLMKAADVGNEEIARILIEKRANLNAINYNGDSAVILAVINNQVNIAKWLIENGADINHKSALDETPLIVVAAQVSSDCTYNCKGSDEVLQLLIDKGAHINAVDRYGRTALDAAFDANQDRKEVIRMLTEHGAQRGATLLLKETALKACTLYSNLTARWNDGITGRTFGGLLAQISEFPWMVALGYLNNQNKVSFSCGGSLISDTFVLTAAHCVKDSNRPVVAQFGKETLTDDDDFRTENQNIREIISHPGYSSSTKKNDIALIQLTERLNFTKSVQPICIQTLLRDEHSHENLIVTGWGPVNMRKPSRELLKVHLKTMSLAECNATFSNYYKQQNLPEVFHYEIDESQYCAHNPNGRRTNCDGFSGAPLQTIRTNSNPTRVVGVVSFDVGCGSGFPEIYTRVAHYTEWIASYVWPNGEIQTPQVSYTIDEKDVNDRIIFPSE